MSHPEQRIVYPAHKHNAEGVALLRQDRHQEAIKCFSKGIKSIIRYLEQNSSDQTNTDPFTLLRYHTTLHSTSCQASNCDQDDVFVLFNCTLTLEETSSVKLWSDTSYSRLMVGMIMYNLGLAMHLRGLQHGDSQKLLDAMHVYFMAYSSLQEFKHLLTDQDDAFGLTLLALINNMAHIHAQLRQFTEASQWMKELKFLLSVYRKPPQTIIMDNADCETFFANACFFYKISWPAPAA